ncbi:hypothetical protein BASA81_012652 [Batrachochytrium salamandrivorans]|nr:hypothetical protein BASA81_012652 [Batrachochytrium salamandrivorans]
MRALILTQSNLVFSTLSQCGSPAICEIAPKHVRFQACVIDEAAQCVEPSVLVPLSLGVERCIMVGDPKQLPATVLSETAAKANYEQSMFERLQLAGHSVHLLDTQYRCRPEMSSFSSVQFYQSRLKDGFGKQRRTSGGYSLTNEEEAIVCLGVYREIRHTSKQAQVAVISPYKDQLLLLQSRFGKLADANLEFNTVDGFQGREVDVVIFSCVRSMESDGEEDKKGGGIGFLADARRLNVAVTRAKYNLFLVGNYTVLKSSSGLWSKLLDHVKQRGKSIRMMHTQDFY